MIRGQSFRHKGETRVQSRETYFAWSDEQKRIIFWDFLDSGGYGQGTVEARNDTLYMEATIVAATIGRCGTSFGDQAVALRGPLLEVLAWRDAAKVPELPNEVGLVVILESMSDEG